MRARGLVAGLIAVVASLVMAASASAAGETAQVTANTDTGDTTHCELRDAIAAVTTDATVTPVGGCLAVDTNGLDDHVTFAPNLSGQMITLNGVDPLTINDPEDLSIEGPGMNQLTISGADADRVFNVETLTSISGLSVVHGACCTAVVGQGGAIFATAQLDLTDVKVADSAASITKSGGDALAAGGGIYTTARLNLNQSIVTGNSATATNTGTGVGEDSQASGGGIFLNTASMTATDSTISDNTADATTDGDATSIADATAGIQSNDQVELDQSTVSGNVANSAESNGGTANARGALYVFGTGAGSSVEQSTIAANTADNTSSGDVLTGGLDIANDMLITASTIALNGPVSAGDNIDGANILVENGSTDVEKTIIAEPRGGGKNCLGSLVSTGFNDDNSPAGASCFSSPTTTDLTSDPLLATGGLADNGGLTQTIALQPTSPMIDQGSNEDLSNPTEDQRGAAFPRPVDFSGLPNAFNGTDIGAFEVQQACPGYTQPTPSTACPSGGGGGTTGTTPLAALAGSSGKQKKGSVGIPISCPAGGPTCQGSVSLTGNVLLAVISAKKKIGSASFSIPAGQKQKVKVRLSKRAINTVTQKGKLVAKLTITTQGSAGPRTSTGKFKIKG